MKKVLFFIMAVATVGFVACSGDGLADVFAEAGYDGSVGSGSSDGCYCTFKLDGMTSDIPDMDISGDIWTATKKATGVSSCSELESYYQNGSYSLYTVTCSSN